MRPCVTLLTDFGTRDGYVGAMKGVLLSHCPGARLTDITHEIPPCDVRAGAFALATAAPLFPPGTIHLAVVDPGVGSSRHALAVQAGRAWFIGPDNGILALAARSPRCIYRLKRTGSGWEEPSNTFHGRDLFAPAAGKLAAGVSPVELADATDSMAELALPVPRRAAGRVEGVVIHADRFGNLITNLRRDDIPGSPKNVRIELAGHEIRGVRRTYSEAGKSRLVALFGSSGYLEIAVFMGSARRLLDLRRPEDEAVRLQRPARTAGRKP